MLSPCDNSEHNVSSKSYNFQTDFLRKPKLLSLIIKIYFSLLTDYPRNITLFMVIFESETETLTVLLLSLWGRYFFHMDPGY